MRDGATILAEQGTAQHPRERIQTHLETDEPQHRRDVELVHATAVRRWESGAEDTRGIRAFSVHPRRTPLALTASR